MTWSTSRSIGKGTEAVQSYPPEFTVMTRFIKAPTLIRKLAVFDELPDRVHATFFGGLEHLLLAARRDGATDVADELKWTIRLLKARGPRSGAKVLDILRQGEARRLVMDRRSTGLTISETVDYRSGPMSFYKTRRLVDACDRLLTALKKDVDPSYKPRLNSDGTPEYIIGYAHINPEGPIPIVEDGADELVRRGCTLEAVVLLITNADDLRDRSPKGASRLAARAGGLACDELGPSRDAALILNIESNVHFLSGDPETAYASASRAVAMLELCGASEQTKQDPEFEHLVGDSYSSKARAGQELGEDVMADFTQSVSCFRRLALSASEESKVERLISCAIALSNRGSYRACPRPGSAASSRPRRRECRRPPACLRSTPARSRSAAAHGRGSSPHQHRRG